jgi:hypothetical protein
VDSLLTPPQYKTDCGLNSPVRGGLLKHVQFIRKSGLFIIVDSLGAGVLVQNNPSCTNYDKGGAYGFVPILEFIKQLADSRDSLYVNEQFCRDPATPEFISRYWEVRTLFAEAGLLDVFFQILGMLGMNPTITFVERRKSIIIGKVRNDKLWSPQSVPFKNNSLIHLDGANRRFSVSKDGIPLAEYEILRYELFDTLCGAGGLLSSHEPHT